MDELAHTNAPGSRFAKRYQDVEDNLRKNGPALGITPPTTRTACWMQRVISPVESNSVPSQSKTIRSKRLARAVRSDVRTAVVFKKLLQIRG